jgi:hypothetical protein
MNLEDLIDEWEGGEETGVRPKRVQSLREDIYNHTGIMPPRRIGEIESWMGRMKGQVTRKLRQAVESDEEGED